MILVGVTGPIASGKSTVCKVFSEMGALLVDVDEMGHKVLQEDSLRGKLLSYFGDCVLDCNDKIDRMEIANIVFNNQEALEFLEGLSHPLIIDKLKIRIKRLRDSGFPGVAVLDAAMLPRWPDILSELNYLLLVKSPMWQRTNRLVQDRGYPEKHCEKRMESQEHLFEKLTPQIDYIIKNNGDLYELRAKAIKAWLDIKKTL